MLSLLLLSACGQPPDKAASPATLDGGTTDGGAADGGATDDTGATGGDDTGRTETVPLCPEVQPEAPDWTEPGPYGVGTRVHIGRLRHMGVDLPFYVRVYYPSTSTGADAPVDASGGPYPLMLFEHAGGASPQQYAWLFETLASQGWVIAAPEHDRGQWNTTPGGYWGSHPWLAEQTLDLLLSWEDEPDSEWAGTLDLDRIAFGGHSHGGGAMLRLAQSWRPMEADAPYQVVAMVMVATKPDRTEQFQTYPLVYDGLPPMVTMVGGAESGSDLAYGQPIAFPEHGGSPTGSLYVEGADHYSWTDDAEAPNATVDRAEVLAIAAPAAISFLAQVVQGEEAALQTWRGDMVQPWADGVDHRSQWHDASAVRIDAFEDDGGEVVQSAAIVGIPGQTFVNGFTGYAIEDDVGHIELIRAQLDALAEPDAHILVYDDISQPDDAWIRALGDRSAEGQVTFAGSEEELASLLAEGAFDLVLVAEQRGATDAATAYDDALAAWICGGGKAVLVDTRLHSQGAEAILACAGAAWDGTQSWTLMESRGDLFEGELQVDPWGFDDFSTHGLSTDATVLDATVLDATVYAVNENRHSGDHRPERADSGATVSWDGFETVRETWAFDEERALFSTTWALELAWEAAGASISWQVGEVDATAHPVLSLRLLALHDDPLNPPSATMDFDVEVVDADGDVAAWSLSDSSQGALRPTPYWLVDTTPKSVFETWRVPLQRLADLDPALDLARIVEVRLRPTWPSGRVLLDDLEWSEGLGCW